MVDRDFLANCREGAWVINTSRGEIIDESALIEAMDDRGLRAGWTCSATSRPNPERSGPG